MRALIIKHDHLSPLGPIAERLVDHGYDLTNHEVVNAATIDAPTVELDLPSLTDFDLVVTMGAKWSAYDHALIGSWVLPEQEALRMLDAHGIPVLGICFGGQLLAAAHGGSVAASAHPEIGWTQIETDEPELISPGPWFQWHFDRWTTPADAREIARNSAAPQAFVLRRNLALQFHPESTASMVEGWLDGGGREVVEERGVNVDQLLEESRRTEQAAAQRAHRLVDGFLTHVAR